MKTHVTYKISQVRNNATYIKEFWNDIYVCTWKVNKSYYGGDIVEFLQNNSAYRQVQFDGIDEYHRNIIVEHLF